MSQIISSLMRKKCKSSDNGLEKLSMEKIQLILEELKDWSHLDNYIQKSYQFTDHYSAISFMNAVAWISHREDHHPNTEVGYNLVKVKYSTHSVGGISENDFICAVKVDDLLKT